MKKVLWIILAVAISLGLLTAGTYAIIYDFAQQNNFVRVGFSHEASPVSSGSEVIYYKAADLVNYESAYRDYNSYVYFSQLTEQEQKVYRIMEYALDNSYPNILFDDRLLEGNRYTLEEILRFLSMDSSMVEQNLVEGYTDFYIDSSRYERFGIKTRITGNLLYVSNFTSEKLERKNEALKKAEAICQQIPSAATCIEKATWIYDYLGQNVTWVDADETNKDFLYDALCLGKSNCDGFANAFSLLCQLVGIDSVEKIYLTGTAEPGHTWNVLLLNGVWYNADATAAKADVSREYDWQRKIRIYFGFSDQFQSNKPIFADILPACTEDFNPVAHKYGSLADTGVKEDLISAFSESTRQYTVFQFDHITRDELQAFVNSFGSKIGATIRNVNDNCTLIFFYNYDIA